VGRGHGHGHGLGGGFTPSSRGGFSLADILDGRAMDAGQDALNYSMGASIEASFRGDGPGGDCDVLPGRCLLPTSATRAPPASTHTHFFLLRSPAWELG